MNDFLQYKEDSDHLQHFGILGMKWGIRRYQNKDGTLTSEGKARYQQKIKNYHDLEVKSSGDPASFNKVNKESKKLASELNKVTGYSKKITEANNKTIEETIKFMTDNPEITMNFHNLASLHPQGLEFLHEATMGSYDEFLKTTGFEDDDVSKGVYKYGNGLHTIQKNLDSITNGILESTITQLGYEPTSEDAEIARRLLRNLQ